MAKSSRRILAEHRRRYRHRGLARLEVQVPASDAGMMRAIARALRGGDAEAGRLRAQLGMLAALPPAGETILDLLICELPDEAFAEILDRDRGKPRAGVP